MKKIFLLYAMLIANSRMHAERYVHFINDTNIVDNDPKGIKYFIFSWHAPEEHSLEIGGKRVQKSKQKFNHFTSKVDLDTLEDVGLNTHIAKGDLVDLKVYTGIRTGPIGWKRSGPRSRHKREYITGHLRRVKPGTYRVTLDNDQIVFERVESKKPPVVSDGLGGR